MIGKSLNMSAQAWTFVVLLAGCIIATPGCQSGGQSYELEVVDLHEPDSREVHKVAMEEEFKLGSSGYSGKITRFVPDFRIDLDTREITSASQELNNPGALVEIYKDGDKVAEQWAFGKAMPHPSGDTNFSIVLLTVEGHGDTGPGEAADAASEASTDPAHQEPDSAGAHAES